MLFPLLPESINTAGMIRHCITVICKIIDHIYSGQCPVITGDQPVNALDKHVQLMYPLQFDKVIQMMGSLHRETAFISAIGDWHEGSGWVDIFKRSKKTTLKELKPFLVGQI